MLVLLAGSVQAGFVLGTSSPPGTPLTMAAGTTSGGMLVTVTGDNAQDVMAAWQFQLVILPEGGTGTLTFQDPATGSAPPPPNYVFGTNGLGIFVTNSGSSLSANDFFDPGVGPGATGLTAANLLEMDFHAAAGASGLFGVYAVRGEANTVWTDGSMSTQYFSNVPDGTGTVLIGEVFVTPGAQMVPAPGSLTLLGTGVIAVIGWRRWRARAREARRAPDAIG